MSSPSISVLIVDDHAVARRSLSTYLWHEPGFTVWGTANSGADALSQLAGSGTARAPDLVVSDVDMPGMSGIELARQLHRLYPDLPCLMHSARVEPRDVEQARAAGARGYVGKGRPVRLVEAIHRAVEASGWIAENGAETTRERRI